MERHTRLWGILTAFWFGIALLCGGLTAWVRRPRPLEVAAAPPAALFTWHGAVPPEQAQHWLTALILQRHPRAREVTVAWGRTLAPLPQVWPDAIQVLGSLQVQTPTGTQIWAWLSLPATQDALQALDRALAQAGWYEPVWARLLYTVWEREQPPGFAPSPEIGPQPPPPPPLRLRCGPQARLLELTWQHGSSGSLVVRLHLLAPTAELPPPCSWHDVGRGLSFLVREVLSEAWDTAAPVPRLQAPAPLQSAAVALHRLGPQAYFGYTLLQAEEGHALRADALLQIYAQQLQSQGWRARAQQAGDPVAEGYWQRHVWLLGPWQTRLAIARETSTTLTAWLLVSQGSFEAFLESIAHTPLPRSPEIIQQGLPSKEEAAAWLRVWWLTDAGFQAPADIYTAPPWPTAPPFAAPAGGAWLALVVPQTAPWPARALQQWYGVLPQDAQQASDTLSQAARAAGWQPEPASHVVRPTGLLAPNVGWAAEQAQRRTFCHPQQNRGLTLQWWPAGAATYWLAEVLPDQQACRPLSPPMAPPEPSSPANLLPSLQLPAALPRVAGMSQVDWGGPTWELLWVRSAAIDALRADLDAQLAEQGWHRQTQGQGWGLTWSLWQPPEAWPAGTLRLYLGHAEGSWSWIWLGFWPEPGAP